MEIISPKQYLNALSNLSKRLIVKKYMLVSEKSELPLSNELEKEINERLKSELGYGIDEISKLEEINKYEVRIDFEFSKITTQELLKYPVDDEIELFKLAKRTSIDNFTKYDIEIGAGVGDFLKRLNFSVPRIKSVVRTASQVYTVPGGDNGYGDNVFLMSRVDYHNDYYNVFMHLGAEESKALTIALFLIAQTKLTDNFNPVRFFMNMLFKYGVMLRCNNKTKKFFLEEKVIKKRMDGRTNIVEVVNEGKKVNAILMGAFKDMSFYTEVRFVYGIDKLKYFQDLREQKI